MIFVYFSIIFYLKSYQASELTHESPVLYPLMVPSNPTLGDDTDILCKLRRGTEPVKFQWFHDGKEISSDRKSKITTSERRSVFSMGNIEVTDIGNYTCVATNAYGRDSKTESVLIEACCSGDPPVLYPLMLPSNPSIGDSTDILCSLKRGALPIQFKWMHNSKDINSFPDVKISISDRRSLLQISALHAIHIGNYTCQASNVFGHNSQTELLILDGMQEPPILHPLNIPPDLGIGDSLDIICSLKRGSIPVTFEWKINNRVPEKRVGIQINTSQKRSVYIIDSISASDVGNYSCTATNNDGSDQVRGNLDVEDLLSGVIALYFEKLRIQRKMQNTDIKQRYHPTKLSYLMFLHDFLIYLCLLLIKNTIHAQATGTPVLHPLLIPPDLGLGDSLDIICSLKRGNTPVNFEWILNNKKATDVSGIKINTSERRSVCIIQSIRYDHIGNYTCKVSNVDGYDEAHTELKVEVGACEIPNLYPMFVPPNIGLGDPVELHCSLKKGSLPVTFTWFLNSVRITNNSKHNLKITSTQRGSLFSVETLSAQNIGNYTCQATNDFGIDNASVLVYAEVPPHWTKEPMDTTAAKGSGLVVDCTATGHPTPRVSWSIQKNAEHREPIRGDGQWTTASNGSLIFSRVDESDAGVYVCEAHNGIGPGISKSIQISVHVLNNFTTFLRFEVVKDTTDYGTKSELLIHDSQKADVGHYICQARNQFGEDEGKVKLVVLEPPSPPTGIRASEVQVRSIRLSWQPSSADEGLVENYVVRYWRNDEKRGKLHQVTLPAVQTAVTISNLHPGTSYSVQVFAQNDVGQGDPSQPITFRTVEEAPDGAPLDLRVEPVSSKSIRVSWKPPQRHHWNGPLRGYYVGNKVAHSSSPFTYQTVETTDRRGGSLLIQGLLKATTYTVVVKAFNAAGTGPPSHELQVTTLEEDPPSPPIVGVADVTASSVGIHWNIGSDKQPSVV
ncbi:Down syndrome cell adhesion molecule-like protein 1 homolog, partial [Stegodyphus dumicola]|uniref:Down syndrome cell adhesion molecule-like protein 1 homolog n=1 Tax=Stegodyphus dumicola TaxID=202533 RepID=UPI0015AE16D3